MALQSPYGMNQYQQPNQLGDQMKQFWMNSGTGKINNWMRENPEILMHLLNTGAKVVAPNSQAVDTIKGATDSFVAAQGADKVYNDQKEFRDALLAYLNPSAEGTGGVTTNTTTLNADGTRKVNLTLDPVGSIDRKLGDLFGGSPGP